MMKLSVLTFLIFLSFQTFAERVCDVRPGISVGIRVMEFASGNTVHSKIPMSESTVQNLLEEMTNLQDMGICKDKITAVKCILKFETKAKTNYISLYRGPHRWNSWHLKSKNKAQDFVKNLKRVGFCS
jgi:hypothetical protein